MAVYYWNCFSSFAVFLMMVWVLGSFLQWCLGHFSENLWRKGGVWGFQGVNFGSAFVPGGSFDGSLGCSNSSSLYWGQTHVGQSSGNSCSDSGPRSMRQYPWANPVCWYTLTTCLSVATMVIAASQAKSLTPQIRRSLSQSLYADFSSSLSDERAHGMRESHRSFRLH